MVDSATEGRARCSTPFDCTHALTHMQSRTRSRRHEHAHALSLHSWSLSLAYCWYVQWDVTVLCVAASSCGHFPSKYLKPHHPPLEPRWPASHEPTGEARSPSGPKGLRVHGSVEARGASTRCRSTQPPPPFTSPTRGSPKDPLLAAFYRIDSPRVPPFLSC